MSGSDGRYVLERQPDGAKGIEYSVQKMLDLILQDRTVPEIVAFGRRALRDAGVVGQDKQDPIKVHRAVWDAMKKRGIGWVPDPIRAEFLAAPRHFMESEEGQDDALMVCGDCDEVTMIQACVAAAVMLAVGVETSALCLHSYSPSKKIGHVLNAVYDLESGRWTRVDHSGDWGFGDFKTPTHEVLISLPSGKTICSATSCERATPAAVEDGSPWAHARLDGLPRGTGLCTLGELSDGDEESLQAFSDVLDLNRWDLLGAVEDFSDARASLQALFDRLDFSDAERSIYWPVELDQEGNKLLDAAVIVDNALEEVQTGQRRWALDEEGNYVIERLEGETKAVSSGGELVSVLGGLVDKYPPAALGELPLPPALIGVIAVGAVLVTLGGFWALVQALRELADMARSAEIQAAQDTIKECLKNNDAERCAKLGQTLAKIRSSREEAEADLEAQKAKVEAEKTKQLGIIATLATLAAGAGAFVYFGGPALVTSWLAGRKKAAA